MITSSIILIWLVASLVLSEAYKGMILSFMTTPIGEQTPASLEELLSSTLYYKLFYFETIRLEWNETSTEHIPLLQHGFVMDERSNAAEQIFSSDYLLLKHASIKGTNMDSTYAAADFLRANKYSPSRTSGIFKVGNLSSTKFAYLHLEFTESFVSVVTSLFPKLMASASVEIKGFSNVRAWFTSNGFLFKWYYNSMSHLAAAGFAEAVINYWKTWNPCIYLREVLEKLKTQYNVGSIEINAEVSKCLRLAISAALLGRNHQSQESGNPKALSIEQLSGVFLVAVICIVGASALLIFERILTRLEGVKAPKIRLIKIISGNTCIQRKRDTTVVTCCEI